MERTLGQRLTAEFVGAFALIFIGAGAIITSGQGGLVGVALAHGLVIAVMVSSLGHISGGHFNPAVTFGMLITGNIKLPDAASYILTQLLGAVAAAFALRSVIPEEIWSQFQLGAPQLFSEISVVQGIAIEAILTFFLVWVVFATAVDPEGSFGKIAGLAIGFTISFDIIMGGLFTGAAMNPARAFGPAVAGSFWTNQVVYWAGPLAGAAIAALLYQFVMLPRRERTQVAAEELGVEETVPPTETVEHGEER